MDRCRSLQVAQIEEPEEAEDSSGDQDIGEDVPEHVAVLIRFEVLFESANCGERLRWCYKEPFNQGSEK